MQTLVPAKRIFCIPSSTRHFNRPCWKLHTLLAAKPFSNGRVTTNSIPPSEWNAYSFIRSFLPSLAIIFSRCTCRAWISTYAKNLSLPQLSFPARTPRTLKCIPTERNHLGHASRPTIRTWRKESDARAWKGSRICISDFVPFLLLHDLPNFPRIIP